MLDSTFGQRGGPRFRKPDFDGFMNAFVVDNADNMGRVLCYVPRLFSEHEAYEDIKLTDIKIKKQTLSGKDLAAFIKNENAQELTQDTIQLRNCMWFMPVDLIENDPRDEERIPPTASGRYKIPRVGSWITVMFLDSDPKKPFWIPWTLHTENELTDNYLGNIDNGNTDWENKNKKPNIEVLHEWHNGNILEHNANIDTNSFVYNMYNPSETIRSPRPGLPADIRDRMAGNEDSRVIPSSSISHRAKFELNRRVNEIEIVSIGRKRLLMDEIQDNVLLHSTDRHALLLHDREKFLKLASSQGHRMIMDDKYQELVVNTREGHVFRASDRERLVEIYSAGKHRAYIDDILQEMRIVSAGGHQFTINELTGIIEMTTNNGYRFTLSAFTGSIIVQTGGLNQIIVQDVPPQPPQDAVAPPEEQSPQTNTGFEVLRRPDVTQPTPGAPSPGIVTAITTGGNYLELNDLTKMINMFTPGALNMTSTGAVNVASNAAATVNSTGPLTLNSVSNISLNAPTILANSTVTFTREAKFLDGTDGVTN